jgi:hypothetical protein
LKRELESLSRDQNDLRQRAEELAQEMARQAESIRASASRPESAAGTTRPAKPAGATEPAGAAGAVRATESVRTAGSIRRPAVSRRSAEQTWTERSAAAVRPERRPARTNRPATRPAGGTVGTARKTAHMRSITEEMRNAAGDLRRQDAEQASARAQRARWTSRARTPAAGGAPDGRRRCLATCARVAAARRRRAADWIGGEPRRRPGRGRQGYASPSGWRTAAPRRSGAPRRRGPQAAGCGERERRQGRQGRQGQRGREAAAAGGCRGRARSRAPARCRSPAAVRGRDARRRAAEPVAGGRIEERRLTAAGRHYAEPGGPGARARSRRGSPVHG